MQAIPYSPSQAEQWDEFAMRAPMATFLHTRRYLAYHVDRFVDASLILTDSSDRVVGLFPAATDPTDPKRVVSHAGITYGGILSDERLRGAAMLGALRIILKHYSHLGYESLRYKAVPYIYHRSPSSDDLYALFRENAVRYRCDLSCAIDLASPRLPSNRRRRGLKKALTAPIVVDQGSAYAGPFWDVLEDNLRRKFGAAPVHSRTEILDLHQLFPDNIEFVVGKFEERVVAGVVLFHTERVAHVQYVGSNEIGYNHCALDAVFEQSISRAAARGARFFDFGTSNEDEGKKLNESLYQFKAEFGGSGVAYESYEIDLDRPSDDD